MEDVLPDAFGRPADEPIVEGLARAIDGRGVDPATAGFQHMDNPADNTAIINPRLTARVARKMRHKPSKLILAQPEAVSIHPWSPFEDLESQHAPIRESVYGSGA